MAIRLPITPARQTFYTPITVYESTGGKYVDGLWVDNGVSTRVIAGSFQPPRPLRLDIGISGDVGLGERRLWTTAVLPYYDIESVIQCWVNREGLDWRITDRHVWDAYVSRNLYVYILERYHRTAPAPEESI